MKILALDAATRTGWAYTADGYKFHFGALELSYGLGKKPSRGARLARARTLYGQLMLVHRPDLVLVECPFSRGNATTRLLYGLAAVAEGLAHECGAAFLDLEPSAVRKRLLGSGAAGKAEILAWARGRGYLLEDWQDDEADALALLEVGMSDCRTQAPAPARRKKAA